MSMGQFAHSTAAMPLPPAQAEALYDLMLNNELDVAGSVSVDGEQLLLVSLSQQEATRGLTRRTTRGGNPAHPSSDSRTKA
jgi:hypothetical protein